MIWFFVAALCAQEPFVAQKQNDMQRAENYLNPFKTELMQTMKQAVEKKGAAAAVDTCHLQAPAILNKNLDLLKKDHVEMGRTSDKLRNTQNVPRPWVVKYLAEFIKGSRKDALVVEIDDKRVGYLAPIGIQPLCLNCHGQKIDQKVQQVITENYPKDQATNYKIGDFRGLFWVEMNR